MSSELSGQADVDHTIEADDNITPGEKRHQTEPWKDTFPNEVSSVADTAGESLNVNSYEENRHRYTQMRDMESRPSTPTEPLIFGKASADSDLAQPLQPCRSSKIFDLTFSLFLCLLPLPFLVLAILAKCLDGKPISQYGENVKEFTVVAPTIFTIVFAAVAGQSLKNIARFGLERSCRLKVCHQSMCEGRLKLTSNS
jgi:hypothetical protein